MSTKNKLLLRTIYIADGYDRPEAGDIPLDEALLIMTDDWIDNGNYCPQTIIDLRDALKAALKQA